MSVHYIIDGYNIVKQIPQLTSKRLKTAREGLIQLIKKYKLTGSSKNEVTIVFDGQENIVVPKMRSEFEIIFTEGTSADDRIKQMVTSAKNPSRLIVVTNDKEVVFFARNHRANVYSASQFLSKILKENKKSKESNKIFEKDSDLSSDVADKITKDLKKIWLSDDKK